MAKRRSLTDTAKDPNAKEKFIQAENSKKKVSASDTNTKMMNVRLSPELIRQIKMYCVSNDITMQQFVEEAANDKLK
jgi:predicted HicB family RNase H-like nuclease